MSEREVKIWSIYNKDQRLVLALSDEPGELNFSKVPDEDVDPVECPFATLQCYDSKHEPEILTLLFRSSDLEDFLDRMLNAGYKVREGRPKPRRFARL
jgi:hypothetical protein